MSERNRLRSIWTLAYMNGVVPMRTQPLDLLSTIASPLSFLFVISVLSQGSPNHSVYILYAIVGGFVLTMMSVGTGLQTDLTHYKQDLKFQELVVASPVEAPTYIAGMALSEFLYALPGLGVFVLLWLFEFSSPTIGSAFTLLGTLILVWAFASALSFTLATYFADVRETFVFSPLISLGLTVLPPVYYSASILPAWAQPLVFLSPTTYAADLLHRAFGLDQLGPYLLPAWANWLALIVWAAAFFLLAALKAQWRER
jgi:ABC-2 type transport system permease protein